jgi:hypothetical protein
MASCIRGWPAGPGQDPMAFTHCCSVALGLLRGENPCLLDCRRCEAQDGGCREHHLGPTNRPIITGRNVSIPKRLDQSDITETWHRWTGLFAKLAGSLIVALLVPGWRWISTSSPRTAFSHGLLPLPPTLVRFAAQALKGRGERAYLPPTRTLPRRSHPPAHPEA